MPALSGAVGSHFDVRALSFWEGKSPRLDKKPSEQRIQRDPEKFLKSGKLESFVENSRKSPAPARAVHYVLFVRGTRVKRRSRPNDSGCDGTTRTDVFLQGGFPMLVLSRKVNEKIMVGD